MLYPLVLLIGLALAAPAEAGPGKAARAKTGQKAAKKGSQKQKARQKSRRTRPKSYLTERGSKNLISQALGKRRKQADWQVFLHKVFPALGKREARQTFTALDGKKQNGEPGRMMSGYINVQRKSKTKGTDRVKANFTKQRWPSGHPVRSPSERKKSGD